MTVQMGSDNIAGASPEILDAVRDAAIGTAAPYGADDVTARAIEKIRSVFEAPNAEVVFCSTGTAANSIALAAMTPPWGAIYCHPEAHIHLDECGAPEFFSGGAKLVLLPGRDGLISIDDTRTLAKPGNHDVHNVQPSAISITQCTERGLVYSLDHIAGITAAAKKNGLRVHMDGARFANACAALSASPADLTWKAGIDVLCFGATKNGALGAEAIIAFDQTITETLAYRRKRAGHLLSKMRFLSAQMEAYLTDDLWLRNATHANTQAGRLAEGFGNIAGCTLAYPCHANEVFVMLPKALANSMRAEGFGFATWRDDGHEELTRFVCAFDSAPESIDTILEAAQRLSA